MNSMKQSGKIGYTMKKEIFKRFIWERNLKPTLILIGLAVILWFLSMPLKAEPMESTTQTLIYESYLCLPSYTKIDNPGAIRLSSDSVSLMRWDAEDLEWCTLKTFATKYQNCKSRKCFWSNDSIEFVYHRSRSDKGLVEVFEYKNRGREKVKQRTSVFYIIGKGEILNKRKI